MAQKITLDFVLSAAATGLRLDRALAERLPEYSRSRLQQWLRDGQLLVDGQTAVAKQTVRGGEHISLCATPVEANRWEAHDLPVDIVYEDDDVLVIDKSAGRVVHPGAGHAQDTLMNALLYRYPTLTTLPRCGLVHRIDKDTTGLLLIAKTLSALTALTRQLQSRTIKRQYEAVVCGVMTGGGSIDAPIGRHPRKRVKMAVVERGKPALTHYRILEKLPYHTRLHVTLDTGRTHQIRVHMAHIRHPIIGDPDYGGRLKIPKDATEACATVLRQFKRQALHACRLTFAHPGSGQGLTCTAPLPEDMQMLIRTLRDSEA